MSEHPPVVSLESVEPTPLTRGSFSHVRRQLSAPAGGRALGCSHMEVPPGAKAWPFHWHAANEEALFVLEGEGTLRVGDQRVLVRTGDYVALPAGPEHAHQLSNTGDRPLRYLCLSTMIAPDVAGYPDSGKLGVFVGAAPGGPRDQRILTRFVPETVDVDYWDGESDA